MDLIKITDLTNQLGLTSRSLRYYEQAGLIKSVRRHFEKYRFKNRAIVTATAARAEEKASALIKDEFIS